MFAIDGASVGLTPVESDDVTAIAILLGLAIGVVVGAVGGGGAILALPVLIYVLDEPVGPASTASLVVVSLAAAIGAGSLARHGRVCWRLAFTFAVPAALGSLLGTLASRSVGGERARAGVRAGDAGRRGRDVDAHRATTRRRRLPAPAAGPRRRRRPRRGRADRLLRRRRRVRDRAGADAVARRAVPARGRHVAGDHHADRRSPRWPATCSPARGRTSRSRPSWRSRPASARCSGRWSASGCRSRCCGAGSRSSSPSSRRAAHRRAGARRPAALRGRCSSSNPRRSSHVGTATGRSAVDGSRLGQRDAVHAPGERDEERQRDRQHHAVRDAPEPARGGLALALEQLLLGPERAVHLGAGRRCPRPGSPGRRAGRPAARSARCRGAGGSSSSSRRSAAAARSSR